MRVVRGIAYAVLAYLLCLAVGTFTTPHNAWYDQHLRGILRDATPWVRVAVEGGWSIGDWCVQHYRLVGVLALVALLPLVVAAIVDLVPRRVSKDPRRLYSTDERRVAAGFAGGRCEGEWLPFIRCRGGAEQGDHWFPHSKGGATSMQNLVMLCSVCNRTKSAHTPTLWQTARLEWRRRKYWPSDQIRRPGDRFA